MISQYESSINRIEIDIKFLNESLSQQNSRLEQAKLPPKGFAYWTEVIILLIALLLILMFIIVLFCCCKRENNRNIHEMLLAET
jgi:hypothetical protein